MIDYSGSARRFGYYDAYATEEFACRCGWRGSFERLSTEMFDQLFDASCPKCGTMLAIVSFPTADEVRRASREGTKGPAGSEEGSGARGVHPVMRGPS